MSDNQIQHPEISPSAHRKRHASGQTASNQPLTQSSSPNIQGTPPQPAQAASLHALQLSPIVAINKLKCRNFLAALMSWASAKPEETVNRVKTSIQNLIDGAIEPEAFAQQLQRELNPIPQSTSIPFLRCVDPLQRSLPYLRYSLMVRELSIDGIRPPAHGSVPLPPVSYCHIYNSSSFMAAPMPPVPYHIVPLHTSNKMPLAPQNNAAFRPSDASARGIVMSRRNAVDETEYKTSNQIQHPEISSSIPRKRHASGKTVSNQANSPEDESAQSATEGAIIRLNHLLMTFMDNGRIKSEEKGRKVRDLVQRLIYGVLGIREFLDLLFAEISLSVGHMQKSFEYFLPYLRYSLMTNELVMDGIQPPIRGSVPYPYPTQPVAQNQVPAQVNHATNQPSGAAHRPHPYRTSKLNDKSVALKIKNEMPINPAINVLNYLASLPPRNNQI